ncbi:hypothetical protein Ocin01_11755 [Orchesella cincta]|uniref:Uncharacterized protein n=1 Tax=Orchesella cincta TaxID=48709 RepID=A0A1D2MQ90_ORCCI|nr:hypothetical protein Ocin01_11755 [Orchesella cincta]
MDQIDFEVSDEISATLSKSVFDCIKPRGKRKRGSAGNVYELFDEQKHNPFSTITPAVGRHLSIDYSNANVGVFDSPS